MPIEHACWRDRVAAIRGALWTLASVHVRRDVLLHCVWLLCLSATTAWSAAAQGVLATFSFEDHLQRDWRNELVFYPVDERVWGRSDVSLEGPDGASAPMQWVAADQSPNGKASIAFLANIPEFGKSTYSLVSGGQSTQETALACVKSESFIELTNAEIGLRLQRGASALNEGPIQGLRLPSGAWVGHGSMRMEALPSDHHVEITAQGPVFLDANVNYVFGDRGHWKLRFRVVHGEPVILVDETFDAPADARWKFSLSHEWSPTRLFYRNEKAIPGSTFGQQETCPLGEFSDGEPAFVLEPWLHWNFRARQGNWFALYGEASPDMLMVGAIRAGSWLNRDRLAANLPQSPAVVHFTWENNELVGDFPLTWGRRQWMLGATDRNRSLMDATKDPILDERQSSPWPQLLLIKHGDFPLDLVKDYQFESDDEQVLHPCMILRTADVEALRKSSDIESARRDIETFQLVKEPVRLNESMSKAISAYLITSDADLGRHLCEAAANAVQDVVDGYLKQTRLPTPGFAPHMRQQAAVSLLLADAVIDGGHMAPEVRRRIKAQAAFLGYTLNRDDVYAPELGYAGLPNMTTSHYGYQAAAACFNPRHPEARVWIDDALRETHEELENWSDENGGWLEAPHYAMVSYDAMLGVSIMAHNAGLGGDLYHPKMKKIMEWFAKISSPPDSRYGGHRHLPAIGNSYMIEPTGEFGIVARLWRDKDPHFASQMQWMHHQQNAFATPGIGGSYPALSGYRPLLIDATISEEIPHYSSELFPETGVILRTGFPGPRETALSMIAGKHRSHYDLDSGSITLWGKGRILCEEFGYYGMAPSDDHSMVTSASIKSNEMKIEEFAAAAQADYVCGVKDAWRRQVLLVKDVDPLGPNYVVLCDTLSQTDPDTTWRLWTTSARLELLEHGARVTGMEDVDMDVHFALPVVAALSQEAKTRTAGAGLHPDGSQAPFPSTQNGILLPISAGQPVVTAVLLPRLKEETPMTVTTLCEGRVIHLRSDHADDWIFISASPFSFQQDDIEFNGTVGAVQIRAGKTTLTLPAPGRLKAKDQLLEKDNALPGTSGE